MREERDRGRMSDSEVVDSKKAVLPKCCHDVLGEYRGAFALPAEVVRAVREVEDEYAGCSHESSPRVLRQEYVVRQ
jgi:hypothetical protein